MYAYKSKTKITSMNRNKKSTSKRTKISSAHKRMVLKPHFRLFLPWPAVFFMILVVGVLMVGWTFQAGAADIKVTGRVPAPALTQPAVITNVTDGGSFSETPIHIVGTCPLNSYVSIYTNDFFRGSVICSGTGNFEIDADLFLGQNSLSARAYNVTDDEGPRSASLTVFYNPTVPTVSTSTPLVLTTNHKYKGATVGQIVDLILDIKGGIPPYALSVDWGDGQQSVISKKDAGEIIAGHIYKKPGTGEDHSYTIKVTAADNEGTKVLLQLFVIINSSNFGSIVANTIPTRPSLLDKHGTAMWVVYGVVALMATSFYLGEREELLVLRRSGLRRR